MISFNSIRCVHKFEKACSSKTEKQGLHIKYKYEGSKALMIPRHWYQRHWIEH